MLNKTSKAILIFAIITLWTVNLSATGLHRFHTTLTRIDYNSKQKTYEISIQIFKHDLIPLLERRGGKDVEFDKSAEIDKLILDYLNQNFQLFDAKGELKNLRWIGKESDVETIWVYLEIDAAETLENYKLRNTLFFESFPEQTNLVVCRYNGKKADLMFKVGDKSKEIVENKPQSEIRK